RMVPYQTRAVADARQVNAAVPHAEGPETAAQALERVTAHADAELPRRSGHEAGLHRRHGRQPTGPGRRCDLGSARPWLRMEGSPHPLCGQDDHLPVVPFAMAPGRNGRVVLQGQMHHASLPGAHRAERNGPPRLFRFLGEPPRQLGQMLGSPPPIVFDVNHHPSREPIAKGAAFIPSSRETSGGRTVALTRAFLPPNPSRPRVASLRISICTCSRVTSSARSVRSIAWSMVSPSLSMDRMSYPHFMDRIMRYCCPMVSTL